MEDYRYGIVLIDYNSLERTKKYIYDVVGNFGIPPSHIVVIDNYTTSENSDFIIVFHLENDIDENYPERYRKYISSVYRGLFEGIEIIYIKSKENLGFAKANNFGVAILYELNDKKALISNSDIIFKKTINIKKFIKVLDDNLNAVAVGSDVFKIDGTRQSPCKYLNIYDRWWRGKVLWPFLKPFYREVDEIVEPSELTKVYRLIGAFFMIDIEKFLLFDGFDETTFLYGEELILAERAKSIDLCILYFPGEPVMHEDGYTTQNATNHYKKMQIQLSSDLYYYEKYIGVHRWICLITRFIVKSYCKKKEIIMNLRGK